MTAELKELARINVEALAVIAAVIWWGAEVLCISHRVSGECRELAGSYFSFLLDSLNL